MCHCLQPADISKRADVVWRPDDGTHPAPSKPNSSEIYRPDILETIEAEIARLDEELRDLSLDIHAHPELGFEEHHANDAYTSFLTSQGFELTKHFHLETAWKAAFSHGDSSTARIVGINSEMDALKGIGHACGHNLIGMSGVAVACALKVALQKHNIAGNISLLGTPAEEGGRGKVLLMEKGAYNNMDVCLMCHPAPGPVGSVSLTSCLALEVLVVEYKGHTAHAALSPWEGQNALDAALLGYMNISVLRQQLKPTHRVHGVFEGSEGWAPNIIPDYARFRCIVRAPTLKEVKETVKRVLACFEAAGLATGSEVKITPAGSVYEIRQNATLGGEVANVVLNNYGAIDYEWGIKSASTDFGNVTYQLPSLHPSFAIPTELNGGNHTPAFEKAAARLDAHYACLDVSKALAAAGIRVLTDDNFFAEVQKTFKEDELARE